MIKNTFNLDLCGNFKTTYITLNGNVFIFYTYNQWKIVVIWIIKNAQFTVKFNCYSILIKDM